MADFKIAHLSDIHAGYASTRTTNAQGINIREADGYVALSKIITEVIDEKVDALLVAGDIFHSPAPSVRALLFVQSQLRRLSQAGIPAYLLAGNHDTNDVKADIAGSRLLHDPARRIYSHVEPYFQHEVADGIFFHMVSHHMYSTQEVTMSSIQPVKDAINVFSTHGSCIDPLLKIRLSTEQSPREIVIPDELLAQSGWSYTLLGHIHERGYPGSRDGIKDSTKRRVYYNGSTLRRGFSDKEVPLGRGWTLWTVDSSGKFTPTYKKVAQRPQVDFPIIDCKDKTAQDISDLMVANLVKTQTKGTTFDTKTAPILRQRLKNIDPKRHAALDWSAINHNSAHALQWTARILSEAPASTEDSKDDAKVDTTDESTDVMTAYNEWLPKSKALESTDKDLKETVQDETRKFIELGQETVLND